MTSLNPSASHLARRHLVCLTMPSMIFPLVRGDDFTSLASDVALTWMEDKMAEHFELKLRGRLGCGCEGELRILNRIVRVTSSGLEYEADPRHVELISESLELTDCKPVVSPGVKNHEPELESKKSEDSTNFSMKADNGMSDIIDVYMALTSDNPRVAISSSKSVTFNEDFNTSHDVIAYSEVYGSLPFTLFATISGWKKVGPRANPYTGKSSDVMSARLAARARRHDRERINLYRHVMIRTVNGKLDNCATLLEPESIGVFLDSMANRDAPCHASMTECEAASFMSESPDLEISHPLDCIAAVKGKAAANKFKKRLGAKKVKHFERDAALADGAVNPTAATTYRAVSARSNYLAQDWPDGTFSSKDFCREFPPPPKTLDLGSVLAGSFMSNEHKQRPKI